MLWVFIVSLPVMCMNSSELYEHGDLWTDYDVAGGVFSYFMFSKFKNIHKVNGVKLVVGCESGLNFWEFLSSL